MKKRRQGAGRKNSARGRSGKTPLSFRVCKMGKIGLKTEILQVQNILQDAEKIIRAAKLLRAGEVVAIPTETVYGLAANALDEKAVAKIFAAKGRPQDNPLIVHIAELATLEKIVKQIPECAIRLANEFWPGPLTMILEKRDVIPDAVSAGLATVGVRFPAHRVARALIDSAGIPLAAPSANTSGRPSPTTAEHVREDMDGKIPAIVDGGACGVGVESTVVDLTGEKPRLLRPGGITPAELRRVLGEIEIDPAVTREIGHDAVVRAPGMKYRHYAPKAPVIILDGDAARARDYIDENSADEQVAMLCFEEERELFSEVCEHVISYGSAAHPDELAHELFDALRRLDTLELSKIYAREPAMGDGMELAVINRLQKAAGFVRVTV